MRVELLKPNELTPELVTAWSQVQRANPQLRSPFFRPEFTELCARVHRDIEIAVLEDDGKPWGFFPFHRVRREHAVPIGKDLSDFQGVVAPVDRQWSLSDLMRGCRLKSWEFNHLVPGQGDGHEHTVLHADSPYADLTGGFAAYRLAKRESGSKGIERTERSQRCLAREEGELEFRLEDLDLSTLPQMLTWRRANLERRGTLFLNQGAERDAIVRELLSCRAPEFSGWYSTLRAGGKFLAGSIYLRSCATAHWWLSSYDATRSKHAPGAVSILMGMQAAAEQGVARIDFGRGTQEIKLRLMTGAEQVAEGLIEVRPMVRALRRICRRASHWLWESPLKTAAKGMLAQWRQWRVKTMPAEEA